MALTSKKKKEQLNQLFAIYNKRLGRLYSDYIKRLLSLGYDEGALDDDALFNFDNFPELKARLNNIFNDYFQSSLLCYESGITDGVTLAYNHDKDDLGAFTIVSNDALKVARATAAKTFIANRLHSKEGLNLAQTVWNYCQQSKGEFEMAMSNVLADGIKAGESAEQIGSKLRQYLNNPDMMYRRYHTVKVLKNGTKKDVVKWYKRKVINGKVRFVDEPLEAVGTGVYRSARKNALRVARTEINAAYLKAHNERWRKEPFVIGQWIHVSPEHDPEKHHDICDELQGRYPKDFVWLNWHPQCRCTSDPITLQGDEKKQFYKRLMAGEDMSNYVSPFAVTDVPDEFKQYIRDNTDAIVTAGKSGKLAWHLRDNTKYWAGLLSAENRAQMGLNAISRKDEILEKAKARHIQRTQEQIDKIQSRWNAYRRNYYYGMAKGILPGQSIMNIKSDALRKRYFAIRYAIADKKNSKEVMQVFNRFKQGYEAKLTWTDRKVAMNILKTAQKYGETDFANVQALLQAADYAKAREAAKTLAKQIKAIQLDEASLSKLIPDVNKWHKQFTSKELHGVYDAVESKLAQWEGLSLEKQVSKLKFEAEEFLGNNWHGVQQKYATWQVSQAAYFKKLAEVKDAIDWANLNSLFADVKSYKTQSKVYHKMVYDLGNAINAHDKNLAEKLLKEAQDKKLALIEGKIKRTAKDSGGKPTSLYDGGNPFTADELAKAKDYETKIINGIMSGSGVDRNLIEKYHDYILKISEKYYDKQVSQFTNEEREAMRKSTKKYLARLPKNPNYIWGADLGGVYPGEYDKVTEYLPKLNGITRKELSIVQRFTNGSTFSNCYNLSKDSPYWREKFKEKLSGLTHDEIKELKETIEEWSQGANYTLDRMVRYNGITFRGLNGGGGPELRNELMAAFKSGKPWVNNASCSTSMKLSVAERFDGDTILIIHNKTGAYIHAISDYDSEYEIMTLRGSKYKILAPPKLVGSRYYVELEELV